MAPRILPRASANRLLASLLDRGVGGDINGAITAGDGYFVSARMVLDRRQLDAIAANRDLSAKFARIVENIRRLGVVRLRKMTRPWRTGLFRSSWQIDKVAERGAPGSLRTRLVIRNEAPYARWVHEAGRRQTVARQIVPVVTAEMKRELTSDLTAPAFASALKRSILSQSTLTKRQAAK